MGRNLFFLHNILLILLVLIWGSSCSGKKTKLNKEKESESQLYSTTPSPDPYDKALSQAFGSLKTQSRTIASASGLDYSPGLFDRLDNLKILVFPISSTIHRKEIREDKPKRGLWGRTLFSSGKKYHKPVTFEIKTLLEGTCKQLKRRVTYFSKRYFTGHERLTSIEGKRCKVIEVRRERSKAWGKIITGLKRDQRLAVRLYLDSDLRTYGMETDLAISKGRQMYRTIRQRLNPNENVSSGLTIFPINIPNLMANRENWRKVNRNAIYLPRDLSIIAKIKKATNRSYCKSGYHLNYKDSFGIDARIEWCQGDPWPTAIHTQNYFSLLL